MKLRPRLLALALIGLLGFGLLFTWLRQAHKPPAPPLASQPCRIPGYPHEIECGALEVPLFHGRGGTEYRPLRWYRIPARARYPLPDPVVWIAETGVDASERAAWLAEALKRARNTRDLIWLETRGAPSTPEAACLPPGAASIAARIDPLADASAAARCREAWQSWGGPANLDARTRAADLALLRRALRLQRVNLLAEGSGARVARAWAESEPDALRTVTLDSPPPLNGQLLGIRAVRAAQALQAVFAACARDAECHARQPDPAADLAQARARLPAALALPHPQTGARETLHLTDTMLALMLEKTLHSPARAAALPAALNAAARGDWPTLLGVAALAWQRGESAFAWESWLAEACMDGSRLAAPASSSPSMGEGRGEGARDQTTPLAAWFFKALAGQLDGACGGVIPYTPAARQPIAWPVPTLVLSGAADPLGDAAPDGALTVSVPGAGHGVLAHGCARDVLFRLLRDAGKGGHTGLEAECLERVPYPLPYTPAPGAPP